MIKDQIHLLKQLVHTLQAENDSRNRQRIILQNHINILTKQNDQLQALIKTYNKHTQSSLTQRLTIQTQIKQKYELEITQLKRLVENNKKLDLKKNSSVKESDFKAIQQQLILTKKEIQSLRAQLIKKSEQSKQLQNQKQKLESEIKILKQRHNKCHQYQILKTQSDETINKIVKQNTQLTLQLKSLNQKLNLKNIEYSCLNKQLTSKYNQWETQKQNLKIKLNDQLTTILTLQSNLHKQSSTELNTLRLKEQQIKSQMERLIIQLESKKNIEEQLKKYKQQYDQLLTINFNVQNQNNLLRQNQNRFENQRNEYMNYLTINKQLEKKILVLENSNRKLNEQLIKTNFRVNTNNDQLINSLKNELAQCKSSNSHLNHINAQLLAQLEQKNGNTQNYNIRSERNKSRHTDLDQYDRLKFNSILKISPKIEKEKIGSLLDKSKWNLIQKKIISLKKQNDNLRKSFSFNI